MLEIGSIIDGKYKILNKIGQGGMSIVYLAMNERANKQWAVKEVRKDGVKDYEVVRQGLIAETDILKRLNHPNLPSIIDVIDREDTFLIVMDYIEGKNLDYWLKKEGAQPQDKVVRWAMQICDVLGYLHSRRPPIIYRDLKPANIMLRPDGNIEIIDFGTAREFKESSVEDTSCLGTQGYAAPEQYGGHGQTDQRTDIYTLGATMYHLLTGHNPSLPPYEMYPIRHWNPQLSSGLEQIVLKCTQRDPANRYQNCAELMYALQHYTELDSTYQKKQKRKMHFFAASVAAAVISLGGFVGFGIAADRLSNETYEGYMSSARTASSAEEVLEYCTYAVREQPGEPEAYDFLLNYYDGDSDGLTFSEYNNLDTLLTQYKSTFEKQNKDDYVEFCYQLGVDLFLSDYEAARTPAQTYLGVVSDYADGEAQAIGNITQQQVEMAIRLASILENESLLDSQQNNEMTISDDYNYSLYWDDLLGTIQNLDTVTSADGTDDVVLPGSAVRLYKRFLAKVRDCYSDFISAGITKREMEAQLDTAEEILTEIQDADASVLSDDDWTEVWSTYSAALRTVTNETGASAAGEGGSTDE